MRNVCFFNSVKFWGGGEKLHLEYALEFRKRYYNVFLISEKDSALTSKAINQNLPVFKLSVGNLSFFNPIKIIRLLRFYKKRKIDTVIFSTSHDLKLGSLSAKIAGVKNIVYLRGLAVPIKNNLLNHIIFRYILTHIVANSQETKKSILQNLGKFIQEDKVKMIYHGIETESSVKNDNIKIDDVVAKGKGVILGNAGRLTHQKGQHLLIEIAKRLKEKNVEFTLFIAGTGDLQTELESLIKKHKLENEVILLGFVSDMQRFMNSIDIFLLTSIWEGFGYVLVEAMINSKPVIAFDISSNPEIITRDKTGILIDYPDLEMFAQKTEMLIGNKGLCQQIGERAKKSVFDKFNLNERITEFEYYLLGKNYIN